MKFLFTGVIVQTLTPGATHTKLLTNFASKEDELNILKKLSTSAECLVSYAINTVGWADECDGHPKHFLLRVVLDIKNYF